MNKRYDVYKEASKRVVICMLLFFIVLIVPFILSISKNTVARFWGDIILYSLCTIFIFIVGIISIIPHKAKHIKVKKAISGMIMGILCLAISTWLFVDLLPQYYMDIPKVITSDYSVYEGQLTNFFVSHGRTVSTSFTIKDKKFKVYRVYSSDTLVIGKVYRVKYLPSSNYAMSLEVKITK